MRRLPLAPKGNIFNSVQAIKTPQSRHNLSYVNKVTTRMGDIVPIWYEEVTPGYNVMVSSGVFGRMMPTISPIMQEINIEIRYFYVPYRLIWDNFEDFVTGVGDHIWPYIAVSKDDVMPGSLADYFGCGLELEDSEDYYPAIDQMPYRAYNLIWNEYFRDENIQNEVEVYKAEDGGDNAPGLDELPLLKCDWKKDYFTSALPWTQRGDMAQFVGDVFLNDSSNYGRIVVNNDHTIDRYSGINFGTSTPADVTYFLSHDKKTGALIEGKPFVDLGGDGQIGSSGTSSKKFVYDPNGTLGVSFGLNQLRLANAMQRFFERSALSGNRYSEYILGMFGVKCADSRLQRPEYLGGGVMPFQVLEVMQNEQAQLDAEGDPFDGSTPQGHLAGIGKVNGVFGFNKPYFFPEYGIAIGLMYIRPKANYMNGTRKMSLVGVVEKEGDVPHIRDRFERLYNPFFEHIGEEAVFSYELYSNKTAIGYFGDHMLGRDATNRSIFGYQTRNAFRKFRNNEVHGDFLTTLKYWHLGREFIQVPELNDSFLGCVPSTRIFAVEDDSNKFIFDIYNKVEAVLPMSAYSIPAL